MAEAAAVQTPPSAEAPAAEPAGEAPAPFVDPVDGAFERIASEIDEAEGTEAPPDTEPAPPPDGDPKPEPDPKAAAEALAAADEALFSDKALSTPAGMKAAVARVRALRTEAGATLKKAEKQQRQNDRDFIVLKKKAATFDRTKSDHLSWFSRVRDEARLMGGHLDVLGTSNEPAQILDSLGFLTRRNGRDMFELLVKGGAKMRKEPDPEMTALQRQLAEMREEQRQEREANRQTAEQRRKAEFVQRREAEIITGAKDATAYPTLATFAEIRPREVLSYIADMKREHKDTYGTVLPDAEAMVELEKQLALLTNGQRGGAGNPQGLAAVNPGGQSSQSSSTRHPSLVAGIPPSASTRVPAQREPTDEERRQDITPELLQDIGLW